MNLNKLDLNKLNTFLKVAQHGSMSIASKELLLTRSAVSQSVTILEASLGIRLFNRVGRRLVLTEAGRTLADSISKYQAALSDTISGLSQPETTALGGMVRLGLFIGFSKSRLTDIVASFLNEFPRVQVKLLFHPQAELAGLLTENRIDFALTVYPLDRESGRESRLISSDRLVHEEMILVASKKNWISKPSLRDLRELPVIDYFQNGQLFRSWVRHHYGKDIGDVPIRAYGAAIDFVLELILKDVGIGIIPKYVAEPYLERGKLLQITTGKPELSDAIWLNSIKGFKHDAAARAFLERIQKAFES